jgi:phosphoribosylformylglycinamidine cyclo-ligase
VVNSVVQTSLLEGVAGGSSAALPGENHARGDMASDLAYAWAQRTFPFREGKALAPIASEVPQFSSWLGWEGRRLAVTSDGVGTKMEVAERMARYDTIGFDLVAMVVDDLAANGVEPAALTNTLDVDRIDVATVDALMRGLHDAAKVAGVAVIGGEIAELGSRIGGYGEGMHANWCATALGALPVGVPIDGSRLEAGDCIISLQSTSFRSNGYSALRRGLSARFGARFHEELLLGRCWGDWLLEPCRIYAPLITALRLEGLEPKGLAHITGGGIESKFGRTLRATGFGAELDQLFAPTAAMKEARLLCGLSQLDAYRHWNMGNGFLIATRPADTNAVLALAAAKNYAAQIAGRVHLDPCIRIHVPEGVLEYPLRARS